MLKELADLRRTVALLEDAYATARADLDSEFACDPALVKTADGRYVLLDALAALATAQTALARAALMPFESR